jgi:hypothetical protein
MTTTITVSEGSLQATAKRLNLSPEAVAKLIQQKRIPCRDGQIDQNAVNQSIRQNGFLLECRRLRETETAEKLAAETKAKELAARQVKGVWRMWREVARGTNGVRQLDNPRCFRAFQIQRHSRYFPSNSGRFSNCSLA